MSAAARTVSPARTPRPPLYDGMAFSSAISIEKYATMRFGERDLVTIFPDTLGARTGAPLTHSISAYKRPIFEESRHTSKQPYRATSLRSIARLAPSFGSPAASNQRIFLADANHLVRHRNPCALRGLDF